MSDNSSRTIDEILQGTNKNFLIVGYVGQIILCILIIVYCLLSPSLFSSIALLFLLIGISITIATPYYLDTKKDSDEMRVYAYPIERIIWIIFGIVNISQLTLKMILYFSDGIVDDRMKQFFQVQDVLHVFLPLLLLPFIVMSMFVKTMSKNLDAFQFKIYKGVRYVVFVGMGCFVMLIQIFSVSIAGLMFFVCMIAIFIQRFINYRSFAGWIIVVFAQFNCLIFIVANVLTASPLLFQYQHTYFYNFFGINAINNFLIPQDYKERGYFICLILLYCITSYMQRIFIDTNIHELTKNLIKKQQIIDQTHMQMDKRTSIDASQLIKNAQIIKNEQIDSPYQKVKQVQVEMENLSERSQSSNKRRLRQPLLEQKQHSESIKDDRSILQTKKKTSKQKFIQVIKMIFDVVIKIKNFMQSTQFSLRFVELLSIIVIQRYFNVYSFVVVLWLVLVASVQKIQKIYYATLIVLLPVQIGNYIIMYLYNANQTPISVDKQVFGFKKMNVFSADVIIFNFYLFYIITFLKAAGKDRKKKIPTGTEKNKNPALWIYIVSYVFKYSYLLTLIALFFFGFSYVSLINLVYAALFLVFFSFGNNLILQKKNINKKQIFTTFSRKYWWIIVYYTLICISVKYCYFLFFSNGNYPNLKQKLQPTGIPYVYTWSFTFSLSKICESNTTPYFLIYILAQIQIMIYRSSIYRNYSFALNSEQIKKSSKKGFRDYLQDIIQFISQFYYQSLFYISGLIILACNYRWNVIGLFITFMTCVGLVRGFNKAILGIVVFMDLSQIILNYMYLFLKFQYVQELFHGVGSNQFNIVNNIGIFLGFDSYPHNQQIVLTSLFALNIVIFYFAVQSYALMEILVQDRINNQQKIDQYIQGGEIDIQNDNNNNNNQNQNVDQRKSSFNSITLQDAQFGENFNKGVILETKRRYNTVLWKKYKVLQKIFLFLAIVEMDLVTIFVLVSCLCFRLSISMFYFLFVYIIYYFILFDRIGSLLQRQQYYTKLDKEVQIFKQKQKILCDRDSILRIVEEESTLDFMAFIKKIRLTSQQYRYKLKYQVLLFTSYGGSLCLIMTYAAQFITSQFYQGCCINFNGNWILQAVLFVIGVSYSSPPSYFRQTYFYYFMIVIAIVQGLLLKFLKQLESKQKQQQKPIQQKNKNSLQIQDADKFIDENCHCIQSSQQIDKDIFQSAHQSYAIEQQYIIGQVIEPNYVKQTNLLIYFKFKGTVMKINYIYGTLKVFLRLCLLTMFINLYQKQNIFAFAYLFAIIYFWISQLNFKTVRHINKVSIIILLLQYAVLLLDIQQRTSTLPLPYLNGHQLSVLTLLFPKESKWIPYLQGGENPTGDTYLMSFLISSMMMFLTQFYFALFFWATKYCITLIRETYKRYEFIQQTLNRTPRLHTIYLNYESFKNQSYRFMILTYQLLLSNSYMLVTCITLILLCNEPNIFSILLVLLTCIFIFLVLFTQLRENIKSIQHIQFFFRTVQVSLFIVQIFITIAQIPIFVDQATAARIKDLNNINQILILVLLQIWIDLSQSSQFSQSNKQDNKVGLRQNVMFKCIGYQQNNSMIKNMLIRYRQLIWLQINIKDALRIIKQWHNARDKKTVIQLQNIKMKKRATTKISKIQKGQNVFNIQNDIEKEQKKKMDQKQSTLNKVKCFLNQNISVPLKYPFYQIQRFVVYNNHRMIKSQNINIDIWDYVLQNYQKIKKQIQEAQQNMNEGLIILGMKFHQNSKKKKQDKKDKRDKKKSTQNIGKQKVRTKSDELKKQQQIKQDEQESKAKKQTDEIYKKKKQYQFIQNKMDKLSVLRDNKYSDQSRNYSEQKMGVIKTPQKIFFDVQQTTYSTFRLLFLFFLTNFSYFVAFMAWIYYLVNPCLLSLPFIVYLFAFQMISERKYPQIMVTYIVLCIIFGLAVIIVFKFYIQIVGTTKFFQPPTWIDYFFYDNISSIGYLLFLLILIYIHEQIKKYQGIKQKHYSQAQNIIQGFIRIYLNQDQQSNYNLRKYQTQQYQQEQQFNPLHHYSQKIQNFNGDIDKCQLPGFFQDLMQSKTGIDLYPIIACIQIFLTIYLIFFYALMVSNQSLDTQEQQFKYFQFSNHMVLAVFANVVAIVLQRKITLISHQNKNKVIIKYCYTMFILILVLIFIFYIAPVHANYNAKDSTMVQVYQPNAFLMVFTFFYCIYFYLSAIQIKFGYKKYKRLNTIMSQRQVFNNLLVIVYTSIPFLYQLKLMMDYAFCQTSLDIFQWFRLVGIYYAAFKAKLQFHYATSYRLGSPRTFIPDKIIGLAGFIGILIVIFGPMLLFSGLNPIAQTNLVVGGSVQIGVQVHGGNFFSLYQTSHFSKPPQPYDYNTFVDQHFNRIPSLQFLTPADIPQQFQYVEFEPTADVNWGMSRPNYQTLISILNQTATQLQNNLTITHQLTIVIIYSLQRNISTTTSADTFFYYPLDGSYLTATYVRSLYYTSTTCGFPTALPNFYISLIRLFTLGNIYKPKPIIYTENDVNPYLQNVSITLFCDNLTEPWDTSKVYWNVTTIDSTNSSSYSGIFMNVVCDKYQSLIGGLGFTALYTSVILVIAGFVRGTFQGNIPQTPYFQNPKPDNIIQISEAIGTLRDKKLFKRQYMMYYQLNDLMRSPDLMKHLSGNYPELIEQANQKRLRDQAKQLESKKVKVQ